MASDITVAIGPLGTYDYKKILVDSQGRIVIAPIVISATGDVELVVNNYSESLALADGATDSVVTYTVPVAKIAYLVRAMTAGSNVARWTLKLNGSTLDRRYASNFDLNDAFEFGADNNKGLPLVAGDVIDIEVRNDSGSVGDFAGRIYVVEQTV